MTYLLYLSLIIAFSFVFGSTLSFWMPSQKASVQNEAPALSYSLSYVFAPQLLFGLFCLLGWYLHDMSWHQGTDSYYGVLLGIPTLSLALILGSPKRRKSWLSSLKATYLHPTVKRGLALSFVLTLILCLLFIFHSHLTPVSLGNNDHASYAIIERLLKEFPFDCKDGFICGYGPNRDHIQNEVFGAYFLGAFLASALHLETYQIASLFLGSFAFLAIFSSYFLNLRIFRFKSFSAGVITTVFALNPVLFYTMFQGFQSQILAMAFAIPLFVCIDKLTYLSGSWRESLGWLGFNTVLAWGVSVSYPHLFLPLLVFLLFYQAAKPTCRALGADGLASPRSFNSLFRTLILVALVFAMALALSKHRAGNVISYLILLNGVVAGWFVPILTPERIFGYFWPIGDLGGSFSWKSHLLRSIPYTIFAIAGLKYCYRKDKDLFFRAVAILIFVLGGYGAVSLRNLQIDGQLGGYKSYKWLSFFLPWVIPALSLGLVKAQSETQARFLKLSPRGWLLIGLIVLPAFSLQKWINIHFNHLNHRCLQGVDGQIAQIEHDDQIQSINLMDTDWWNQMWAANLLGKKQLYFAHQTYYPATHLEAGWNLESISSDPLFQIRPEFPSNTNSATGARWTLIKKDSKPELKLEVKKGWHPSEGSHRWTSETVSSLELSTKGPLLLAQIQLDFLKFNPKDQLEIKLDGHSVAVCFDSLTCQLPPVELQAGLHQLVFESKLPLSSPGAKDLRKLGFMFRKIEVVYRFAEGKSVL